MAASRSRISLPQPQTPRPATQYSVKAVQSAYVPFFWDFVSKYIDAALEHAHGEMISEDVFARLMAERMYLYVARNPLICGAVTVEVCQYARKKALRVVTLGGEDFTAWRPILNAELLKYAKSIGANGIEAYVRKGLVPGMEQEGYKQIYVGMWLENG